MSFEDWPPEPEFFDLVFSASAFHWISPEVSHTKSAQVLKPGGALVLFYNNNPRPSEGFLIESEAIYRRHDPAWRDPYGCSTEEEIRVYAAGIKDTGLFEQVSVRTYPWQATYSTADYLRLINTHAGHLAMPEANRRALEAALARLIDSRYGGQVVTDYLAALYVARKPGL